MALTKEQVKRAIEQLQRLALRRALMSMLESILLYSFDQPLPGSFFPENHLPIYRGRDVDHQKLVQEVSKISHHFIPAANRFREC